MGWWTCYKEISLAQVAELSKNFDTTSLHYSPTNATAFALEAAQFIWFWDPWALAASACGYWVVTNSDYWAGAKPN